MEKSYKRVENIDDKIMSVKLPYNAWKVLFLVDDDMNAGKMVDILGEEQTVVEQALERLLKEELIELLATETKAEVEEIPPESEEAAVEEAEEIVAEAEPAEEITEKSIIEQAEEEQDEILEETLPKETLPEEEIVKAPEPEEEPVKQEKAEEASEAGEEIAIEDLFEEKQSEDLSETLEDVFSEEQKPEEDVEINIPSDEEIESQENRENEKTAVTAEAPPVPEMPEEKTGRKTILIVDDSIVIRKMVEIALEEENYLLQTAVSGRDGLDKMDSAHPDLVILDLMLPDINGIDILKTIKKSLNIPVIMLSGKDSPQMVENAKEAGADAFLPKPFKDEDLKEKIKSLLED